MFNLSPNMMISIAITFKSIHDWGKLEYEQPLTRAEF
jgi:hypothetical protein